MNRDILSTQKCISNLFYSYICYYFVCIQIELINIHNTYNGRIIVDITPDNEQKLRLLILKKETSYVKFR